MTEYALLIAGVAIIALFTGYRRIGNFLGATLNNVISDL